jgi:hypothetical protein
VLTLDIPNTRDRFWANPPVHPSVGRVVLGTTDGWLPAIPIHHNPMLVIPIPLQVTDVGVNLAEGVNGTYRWLWPGRPVG